MVMATWKVGDATIESGGKVIGDGNNASDIRRALENGAAIFYLDSPPNAYPVDPKSDWVLHRYLLEYGDFCRVEVTTDYVPKDEDIPLDVARAMKDLEDDPKQAGEIY